MQRLFLIVGPSGSGKSTLVSKLKDLGMVESVSVTSRRPRPGEVEGVHYFFVERSRFEELRDAGEMVECVEYNGNLYGSTKASVREALSRGGGKCVVVVEGHGARQYRDAFPGMCETIFLMPPPLADLRRRLEGRGDSAEVVDVRMRSVSKEMIFAVEAEHPIEPGTPEEVLARVLAVIRP